MSRTALTLALLAATALAGCDLLGMEAADKLAAARDAEGKAVGGACRHAGRAIEDCYVLNRKTDKAAIFAGWRDMNDYMRENKIEVVAPQLVTQLASAKTDSKSNEPRAVTEPRPAETETSSPEKRSAKAKPGEGKAHGS